MMSTLHRIGSLLPFLFHPVTMAIKGALIALLATMAIAWNIGIGNWTEETRRLSAIGTFYERFGAGELPDADARDRTSIMLSPDLSLTIDTLIFPEGADAGACRARMAGFMTGVASLGSTDAGAAAIDRLCTERRYALLRTEEGGPLVSLLPLVSAQGALAGAQVNVIAARPRPTLLSVLAEPRVMAPILVATALAAVLGGLLGRAMKGHVERLGQRASVDGLTGALRREAFFVLGERAMRRARRKDAAVAVLVVDLDRLKLINDTRGHAGGDAALAITATALRSALRSGDLLGRLGGDEFAALLPGVTGAAAEAVAERARLAVEESNAAADFGGIRLSVSVGLVNGAGGESLREMVDRADLRLYEAKRRRNAVAS
ncbi:GGDEF domain-containing protein [Oceanicella sp. SM1341]|uniref:GGDEF domain-containing protein n=1 Tax=Oceanicella sp. SM1341 TaxID=1548889 RepID=UPI0013006AA4|nr:GGDEF domain-containing protein [Oceanicella sp. SM1341]